MDKLLRIGAAFVVVYLAFRFNHSQPVQPPTPLEQAIPQPTNARCGYCLADFRTGWAATARCPECRAVMSAKLARRAHGPARKPSIPPPSITPTPTNSKIGGAP